MKRLLLIIMSILFCSIAWGGDYIAVTHDDVVDEIGKVKVEETKDVEKKTVFTLNYIDEQIAKRQKRIEGLQAVIESYQAIRILVDVEAKKVKLKPKENIVIVPE